MKNLLILLSTIVLFTSCIKDFEEGADISFRSLRRRISGRWVLKAVWVDGIDSTRYKPYSDWVDSYGLDLPLFNIYTGQDLKTLYRTEKGKSFLSDTVFASGYCDLDDSEYLYFNGMAVLPAKPKGTSVYQMLECWDNRLKLMGRSPSNGFKSKLTVEFKKK